MDPQSLVLLRTRARQRLRWSESLMEPQSEVEPLPRVSARQRFLRSESRMDPQSLLFSRTTARQ